MRLVSDYLADPKTIEKTVGDVLNITVDQMKTEKEYADYMYHIIDPDDRFSIGGREEMLQSEIGNMRLIEILFLIDHSKKSMWYGFKYPNDEEASCRIQYIDYIKKLMQFMVNCSKHNKTIDMFFRLPLNSIYMIYRNNDDKKYSESYLEHLKSYERGVFLKLKVSYEQMAAAFSTSAAQLFDEKGDKLTVGDFLWQCYKFIYYPWEPGYESPDIYIKNITEVYLVVARFFNGFLDRNPYLDVDSIKRKYS